jgi:hypothetical protein
MVRHELTQEMGKFGFNFRVNLDDLAAIAGWILAGSGGQVVQDQSPYIRVNAHIDVENSGKPMNFPHRKSTNGGFSSGHSPPFPEPDVASRHSGLTPGSHVLVQL